MGAGVFVPFSGGPDIKIPHILELCKPFLTLFLEFVNSHKLEGTFLFRYDRLEELIKGSGKSKIYLCKKMNLGPTYLRDAKKQNSNIKDEPLRILAEELNTTPEYLRGETDDPGVKKAPTDKIDERILDAGLIKRLVLLTPDELRRVDDFVQGILASRKA